MTMPEMTLDTFMSLSELLTGTTHLDRRISKRLLEHVCKKCGGPEAEAMLAKFAALDRAAPDFLVRFRKEIFEDAAVGLLAQQILVLWYVGAIPIGGDLDYHDVEPGAHFGALLWDVIGSHPPALSGGYFGYWRYPPEN